MCLYLECLGLSSTRAGLQLVLGSRSGILESCPCILDVVIPGKQMQPRLPEALNTKVASKTFATKTLDRTVPFENGMLCSIPRSNFPEHSKQPLKQVLLCVRVPSIRGPTSSWGLNLDYLTQRLHVAL